RSSPAPKSKVCTTRGQQTTLERDGIASLIACRLLPQVLLTGPVRLVVRKSFTGQEIAVTLAAWVQRTESGHRFFVCVQADILYQEVVDRRPLRRNALLRSECPGHIRPGQLEQRVPQTSGGQ